jgi:FMNH2-dependent dimethyl sulfone monooxygenase
MMNTLYGPNRMKLGVFGMNVSSGCAITTVDERLSLDWGGTRKVLELADAAGFEALVSVGRWRGFGGSTNFNGACFEPYTWAAGLAGATKHATLIATSHVATIHPLVAAKQATTIDHISGGRFALNVVCGWYRPEMQMFGVPVLGHDRLYDYAAEWLAVVRKLWASEGEFDFEGEWFRIDGGFHEPKPVQSAPPVMNAGSSAAGKRFAAAHADMAFIPLRERDDAAAKISALRDLAREFGRRVQVWANAYVVCRDTEAEALAYLDYYARDHADFDAATNLCNAIMGARSKTLTPEEFAAYRFHFIAGWGGYPLVGTPEQITRRLVELADAGLDGMLLSWVDYEAEVPRWIEDVLPLMEQAGLRIPRRVSVRQPEPAHRA